MAYSSIGHMDSYDESSENFGVYMERFDMFILANGITDDDKRKAIFLSIIGSKTYSLLRSLTAPDKPKDKDLDTLTELLKNHLSPAPLEIAETYRFHQRSQMPGESINEFTAQLKLLAEHCNFGADYRSRVLRDRLVCGISSDSTRRKLLSEANLTLDRALEIARSMEQADKDVQNMTSLTKPFSVPAAKVSTLSTNNTADHTPCRSCGSTQHLRKQCPHLKSECYKCGRKGHLQSVCEQKVPSSTDKSRRFDKHCFKPQSTHALEPQQSNLEESEEIAHINSLSTRIPAIMLETHVNGHRLDMELDTGASVSTIPYATYKRMCPEIPLETTTLTLKPYGIDEKIIPRGKLTTTLNYEGQQAAVQLYVIGDENEVPLFGRDLLAHFTLDWKKVKTLTQNISQKHITDSTDQDVARKYPKLFDNSLGEFRGFEARINVRKEATPVYQKHRVVPFAIRGKVEDEIQSLMKEGIVSPVEYSEWATPVVPVIKPNGTIRLCGDFKVTLNPYLVTDTYPMPSIDDLQEKMSGGTLFSKLDLSRAFAQIKINEVSREYVTITTHLGLFRYNRLPYGISSAPAIHQRAMDRILRDIPGVLCYQDDIFITGRNRNEHIITLETVLKRLQDNGLRVNREKCSFLQDSIIYLGHRIDKDGLHPTEDKVHAVKKAPAPKDVSELRSFLGLVNYYQKFLPDLASTLHPLHRLLNKGVAYEWSEQCETAFAKVKNMLSTDRVLVAYDTNLPLTLACDASAYGLGAVLSHVSPNGEERPIAFASRTLTDSEKNYAQVEREALSLIFGVTKFHIYIYGRKFTLVTDHQSLTTILGPKTNIPPIAAMRMQRWAAILAAYTYDIKYRRSGDHGNADAMSRLPQTCHRIHCEQLNLFHTEHFGELPVTREHVKRETVSDALLSQVCQYVHTGWPQGDSGHLSRYHQIRNELSIDAGCLLRGTRLVIPTTLRPMLLEELHGGHIGMVKMKNTARNYMWWPEIDKDIEGISQACSQCNSVRNSPPSVTHHWAPAEQAWQRIHLDFAGPMDGQMFLIVVDAYSKWPEVFPLRTTTSATTITVLRNLFARQGLPLVVVTDNGPQFTSEDFNSFLRTNGVKHITTAPYHPQSNGQAERFVQTFKMAYKASSGPTDLRVDRFLMKYRTTAHSYTNKTPSELLMGRIIRTRLDLLKPVARDSSASNDTEQHRFHVGSLVWYQDHRATTKKWLAGLVVEQIGNLMYWIADAQDPQQKVRRHHDQLHPRTEVPYQQQPMTDMAIHPTNSPERRSDTHASTSADPIPVEAEPTVGRPVDQPVDGSVTTAATPRRSSRIRHTPSYLSEYITE